MTQNDIAFSMRFREVIELENGDSFNFVLKVSPQTGFIIDWDDNEPVAQTLYIKEWVWAAILAGKLLWTDVQWLAEADQHEDYTLAIGQFWFWLESGIALNNKNVQAYIEPKLHPHISKPIDPQRGVFPMPGEWQ
mgnify:CR=1 FL=1